jgi:hypothetical protein
MVMTFWSLFKHIANAAFVVRLQGLTLNVPLINGIAALVLSALAIFVMIEALRTLSRRVDYPTDRH